MEDLIPLFFLYAEIHYKLFGMISFLWKKLPEVIADTPFRVEPNTLIPVFCIIKDADLFPISLNRIDIEIIYPDHHIEKIIFPFDSLRISEHLWEKIFFVKVKDGFSGSLKINVYFSITSGDKSYYFKNDNYKKIEHRPFDVYVSKEKFPTFDDCVFGDLHYHSQFTSDIAEFGGPLDCAREAASAMGLDFFVSVDHSYDFEHFNHRLKFNFKNNSVWKQAKETASFLNKLPPSFNNKKVIIFQGEEVSCGNSKNKNVHLILFNNDKFIFGSGDNGIIWFRNKPNNDLKNVLEEIYDTAVTFAAHPEVRYSVMEKLFLRRSKWTNEDYRHKNLNGLQILNGMLDSSFFRGLKKWKEILLKGEKKFIVAGSDAHGNFNCYRQAGIPMATMKENKFHIFGNVRTGVFLEGDFCEESIVKGLKKGSYFITNGPVIKTIVKNEKNETKKMGETIEGRHFYIYYLVKSNEEFGVIKDIKIFIGDLSIKKEFVFKHFHNLYEYIVSKKMCLFASSDDFYVRVMATTRKKEKRFMCISNPIWIKRA